MTNEVIQHARQLGLIDIDIERRGGRVWKLTREGENFLTMLDFLRELDDRPGAAGGLAGTPPRSGAVTPPTGRRRGDDDPAGRRGANRNSSGR